MLRHIQQLGEEAFDAEAGRARHINHAVAGDAVDPQATGNNQNGGDDHVGVHRDDGNALPEAVSRFVLAGSGVDTKADADDDGEDRGDEQ